MTAELTVYIPQAMWLSANDRLHWRAKSARTAVLRMIGRDAAVGAKIGRHETTHVAAFIGYLRNGKADPANAAPTTKALIDGMVDAGVWADDDSTHVLGPTHLRGPKSDRPGHYCVRLVLTDQEGAVVTDKPVYGMCLACGSVEVRLNRATGTRDLSDMGEHPEYPTGYGCEVCT